MALSEAGVCNRALGRIGQRSITDLNGTDNVSRACAQFFNDSRDEVLEARPWPFAMRRATLAALSSLSRDGWLYVYAWPADCIAPRYIHNPALQATVDPADETLLDPVTMQQALPVDIPYIVESDATVGTPLILTNQATPVLVYTARVTAPTLWSQHFTDALSFKLASDLALTLTKKQALAEKMNQAYEWALARAGRTFNNQKAAPRPLSVFERNR